MCVRVSTRNFSALQFDSDGCSHRTVSIVGRRLGAIQHFDPPISIRKPGQGYRFAVRATPCSLPADCATWSLYLHTIESCSLCSKHSVYQVRRRTVWEINRQSAFSTHAPLGPNNPRQPIQQYREKPASTESRKTLKACTYIVLIFLRPSKVPFASVSMLLSCNESRFRLAKDESKSLSMHLKELSFKSSNCNWLSSLKSVAGRYLSLLLYSRSEFSECKPPENANGSIFCRLLLDKSILCNRFKP